MPVHDDVAGTRQKVIDLRSDASECHLGYAQISDQAVLCGYQAVLVAGVTLASTASTAPPKLSTRSRPPSQDLRTERKASTRFSRHHHRMSSRT